MSEQIRCMLCGRPPEGDPDFMIRFLQHREAEKQGRARGPLRYICPVCSGRVRYEAEKTQKES
ncbi:MAG TPA: hypothetical protein VIL07_11980 [Symbiobacteriaceae bacterium]